MKKQTTAETVRELLAKTVTELGYVLWDVEYAKEGADYNLTVTIDREEGITIEDCERVHHAIDPVLDEADPIADPYILNVSSPGVERVLRTDEHLAYALGMKVAARFFSAADGQKSVTGILVAYTDQTVTIAAEERETTYGRNAISRLTTVYFD